MSLQPSAASSVQDSAPVAASFVGWKAPAVTQSSLLQLAVSFWHQLGVESAASSTVKRISTKELRVLLDAQHEQVRALHSV
jgi:hypothetical protein